MSGEPKNTRPPRQTPNYATFEPASLRASEAARASSKKRDTKCELLLRKALWARGLRYRVDVKTLPGKPDLVFARHKVVVFCDGDFWHGRDLDQRLAKLRDGHNSAYWVTKITRNVERDRRHDEALTAAGWTVVRLWEKDILRDPAAAASRIEAVVRAAVDGDETNTPAAS